MSKGNNPNKKLKATLLSDETLPPGSVEFVDNYSPWTRFRQNVKSKSISALVSFPLTSTWINKKLTHKAASSGTVSNETNQSSIVNRQ